MEIEAHKRDLNPVVRYEMAKTVKKKKERTLSKLSLKGANGLL